MSNGTIIHNIEMTPGQGGQIVRSAGGSAQVLAKEEKYTLVRLPSGEVRKFLNTCMATVGQLGNLEHKNLIILGSAHNQKEIQEKISQKCTGIFLAPLFKMKKYKQSLGLCRFNYLTYKNDVNFFALGGINKNNIRRLKMLNIKGFAGIRMFKKKPASKRPVFLKN